MSKHLAIPMLILTVVVTGCAQNSDEAKDPASPSLADELTLYYYADYIPQSMLDAFTEEYGVTIDYQTYLSPDEAAERLLNGAVYDIVWISSAEVPRLIEAGALAEIDSRVIQNILDLDANFRDLAYDPGNKHSVPYYWGTTGLVVRTDLFEGSVSRWTDLWQTQNGQVGLWHEMRFVIGLALQSLGYSANATAPEELEAALNRLLELRRNAIFIDETDTLDTSAYALADGDITMALGWSYDALLGRDLNPSIAYVIPEEGTMLWIENMIIPAASARKYTAETFINFMLRPEIAAQYANEFYYAVSSVTAREHINPEILSDTAIYPPDEVLAVAELILPLTPATQQLYDDVWQRFLEAQRETS